MATADEILATMAEEAAETDQMAEVCTIDRCTRAVTIPEALRIVGVETDKDVTRRHFKVLCSYRGTNLSTFRIRIHFMNANKEKDIYYVTDAAQDGEYLTFSWVISRQATKYKGKLQFIACMVCDGGTDEEREWNSTLGEFTVLEGLEVELTEGEEEQARDAITQLLAVIDARESEAVEAVSAQGAAQVAAVQAAGEKTLATIPEDYADLCKDVDALSEDNNALRIFNLPYTRFAGYLTIAAGSEGVLGPDENNPSWVTECYPCKPGDVFSYQGRGQYNAASCCFYDADKAYIGHEQHNATTNIVEITAPEGAAYVRFCSLDDTFSVMKKAGRSGVLPYDTYAGYLTISNGEVGPDDSITGYVTDFVPVKPGDIFHYQGWGAYQAASCCFYNANKVFTTYEQHDAKENPAEIRVPAGVAFVRFGSFQHELRVWKSPVHEFNALSHTNVLFGKKYVSAGDSYTQGTWGTNIHYDKAAGSRKTYAWHIADRNNMEFINMGIGGSTMGLPKTYVADPDTVDINARQPFAHQRYKEVPADTDYLTIWFGINDEANTNLGSIDDTTNETFYGAWNVVLKYYLTNMPYMKVGIIINSNITSKAYRDAIKAVAEKWGYPYLDWTGDATVPALFTRNSGMCAEAANLRKAAFGWNEYEAHPSPAAHEWMSTIVEEFLRKL